MKAVYVCALYVRARAYWSVIVRRVYVEVGLHPDWRL